MPEVLIPDKIIRDDMEFVYSKIDKVSIQEIGRN